MIRTRFAPSPTGDLHIGGLRTALYSYALAKNDGGKFILRIEDTDKKREKAGSKERIKEILKDFGLHWDEYHVQSERASKGTYKKAAESLVKKGYAFYCQCEAKNAKKGYSKELRDSCREKGLGSGCIKLKVPKNEKISFKDYVIGKEISWDTSDISDATLLKTDGFPTYHLAVVVDDSEMKITHALRGYDWLPSTPIHLLVYKYLGLELPKIGHLTDILDPEGGKLSKRKGSVSVDAFLEEGYLPEALLNFVLLLGWAPKDNKEFFTLKEMVKHFSEKGFQKSNPAFNRTKLLWMNGEYIRKIDSNELLTMIFEFYNSKYPKDKLKEITPLVKERIKILSEFEALADFFFVAPEVNKELLGKDHQEHLSKAQKVLEKVSTWKKENIDKALLVMIEKEGFHTGKFFMDFRIAITGNKSTPPINESIEILGKEETIKRLKKVL